MIWEYSDWNATPARSVLETKGLEAHEVSQVLRRCVYCGAAMELLSGSEEHPTMYASRWTIGRACPRCGWWAVEKFNASVVDKRGHVELVVGSHDFTWGCLKPLDCTDLTVPIAELRTYLLAKYQERFRIHPRKLEELVADIFAGDGYTVHLTPYSGDDGLDVVLLENCGKISGIQVKRYRGKILAEQIRALAGALLLNNAVSGVFVTTSQFSKGARNTAKSYMTLGLPIRLYDATALYEQLSIKSRPMYVGLHETNTPFEGAVSGARTALVSCHVRCWM